MPVTDLAGQTERGGVPGAGPVGAAGSEGHFAEPIERRGLSRYIAASTADV
jgi:hypothetical protein